jgi:glycosyltransferase involved in cell wall biosynthesis
MDFITVVITSCNRADLLEKTLQSFFKFNTYPIKKIIIIDDSGIHGCIDNTLKIIPSHIDRQLIYNEKNLGQIKSIDKAYSLVDTEYIFHCEDDWEFYNYGFMEKSLEILKSDSKIFCVWLREYQNGRVVLNGHPVVQEVHNNMYRKLGVFQERNNIWCGFTFNPGLRRLQDYKINGPYSKIPKTECNSSCGGIEAYLSKLYFSQQFYSAITLNTSGYVKHIGWDNPTIR